MISVCILTKNAGATLARTLDSCRQFDEVLLLDNGSTDDTLAIAARYPNVRVEISPFLGFGPLRNRAALLARHDWILALDSDECLSSFTPPPLDPTSVYLFPRHNFLNGKRIFGSGWNPEKVARLYNRKSARFADSAVHERLITKGLREILLPHPLLHTPYRSTADFLSKMQHYSTLFAEQNRGKKSGFCKAFLHGAGAFFKTYFLKWGFVDGKEGLIIAFYNASTAFYKYLKLAE